MESAASSVSHEPSSLMKKLEELKPLPSLEPIDFNSREFINVTQRKTLLTREPLKSHLRISPEKTLSLSEHNKISHEKSPAPESTSFSSEVSLQHKNTEPVVQAYSAEASDSESSSASEDEPKKEDYKIKTPQSSSLMYSSSLPSTTKIAEPNLIPTTCAESPLNKSGSSSGNSSYNSAVSERYNISFNVCKETKVSLIFIFFMLFTRAVGTTERSGRGVQGTNAPQNLIDIGKNIFI